MENELRRVVDALPGLVWTAHPNGHVDYVNQRWCDHTGLGAAEAYGSGWQAALHPEDLPAVLERWQSVLPSGESFEMDGRLRRFDGTYRWFVFHARPITDLSGRIVKWCGIVTDVEDRWWAAEGRRAREHRFRQIFDDLPTPVTLMKPDGELEYANRYYLEYLGRTMEELDSQVLVDSFHPDDRPAVLAAWNTSVETGRPYEFEARRRRADGVYRWFHVRGFPLRDAEGRIVLWHVLQTDIDDRKRAEDALHAHWWLVPSMRERHFRSVTDSIPALAALMIPGGGIECVNRQTLEYFGATLEELQRAAAADHIHPDDLRSVGAITRGHKIEAGEPYDFEARLRRADGVYRWFHVRGFPLLDTDGRVVLWYLLQTDIDDRMRAETLLAGEKRLLEMVASGRPLTGVLDALCQLVESTVSGCYCSVVLVDPSGTHLEYGVAPSLPSSFIDSIIGRSVNTESGPCATAAYLNEQVIAADFASETRWAAQAWCPMALAHGLQSCWSTPISSAAGKVFGAFAIYYDQPRTPTSQDQALIGQFMSLASIAIERAQNDAALRRSEAFLKEAQRLSSTGGFSWNVVKNETTWSDEVYRMFEIELGTRLTPEVTDLRVHPDDRPFIYEKVNRARIDGKDFDFDYRLVMPDGSIKYIHTVFHRGQDPDGQVEFVGAIQDVSERRRSEDALGELRTELARVSRVTSLSALTASIAHEVNQPLAGILTNASTCLRMLAADPPNIDGARETARRTIRDANRAAEVITRLRALFTKKGAASEQVDLNDAVQEVIALSLGELQRNRVTVRTEFAGDLPPITGDRVQLQQVILNLILNASDAMSGVEDRPRLLVIGTERDDGDGVRLTVRDAGIGFDPQHSERLFDAFYTTKSGGMGIGLSVSRSIVESHRGRLWAEANDGPGATFSFSIPRRTEDEAGNDGVARVRIPVADGNRAASNP